MNRPNRLDLLKQALWLALIPGALLFACMQVWVHATHGMIGADSHAYWVAARVPESWYIRPPAHWDAYLYSPAFAQLLWPLGQLPWRVFQVVWIAGQTGVLTWLLAPLGWRRALSIAPFFVTELLLGNIYIFFAGALVLMVVRAPSALALPLLTKIAPGGVGVWLLARGEWKAAGRAALISMAIVAVSLVIDHDAWFRWVRFLAENSMTSRGGFASVRLVAALVVVVWAARRGWAWLLAPAMILACPVVGGYGPLAVLGALPRLVEWQRTVQSERRLAAQQHEAVTSAEKLPTGAVRLDGLHERGVASHQ